MEGLAAKPTIDIIVVIRELFTTIKSLEPAGFTYRGEYSIPFHYCFTKRGEIKVNLHAYVEGNPEIELNLLFRDYLRKHLGARDDYAKLKFDLLKDESFVSKN